LHIDRLPFMKSSAKAGIDPFRSHRERKQLRVEAGSKW
jgi:hypothetical protein